MFRALLIVIALIMYGCLYPFRFHSLPPGGWDLFWHAWPTGLDRFLARDALLNMVLYLPFGMLAFLALDCVRNLRLRLLAPLFMACFLSTTVEVLQLMDFTRTSSVFDVACNVTGAALGIAAGRVYAAPLFHIVARTERALSPAPAAPPLLLLCLWLGYQLFPLFPSIGLFAIRAKWKIFYTQSLFSVSETVLTIVEWLALAAVLQSFWRTANPDCGSPPSCCSYQPGCSCSAATSRFRSWQEPPWRAPSGIAGSLARRA